MRAIGQGNGITFTGTTKTVTFGVGGAVSRVYGVYLVYDSGAPGTTTFAFSNMGRTFFTSAAGNSNVYYPILEAAYGANGAVLATGNPYVEAVVNGYVTVTIASAATTTGSGYGCLIFLYDD